MKAWYLEIPDTATKGNVGSKTTYGSDNSCNSSETQLQSTSRALRKKNRTLDLTKPPIAFTVNTMVILSWSCEHVSIMTYYSLEFLFVSCFRTNVPSCAFEYRKKVDFLVLGRLAQAGREDEYLP
jgi:hypothetical protein